MPPQQDPKHRHPRETWLLAVLAEGPLHGYALMERVEQISEGTVVLGPATLYRALDALSSAGLIREQPMESIGDRQRKPWRITAAGRNALKAEIDALESAARRMRSALQGAET